MDRDCRDWQEEGPEDILLTPRVIADPLLELAADLALCYDAVAENRGSFCSECKCQLGYHLSCEDGVCELCECEVISWLCTSCGKSRSMDMYTTVGIDGHTRVCKYCVERPPVRIIPSRDRRVMGKHSPLQIDYGIIEEQERAKCARLVLAELTE